MRKLLIGILGVLMLSVGAWATTYNINASSSGSVDATSFIDNDLVIYLGSSTLDYRGWMKFDVSGITLGPGEVVASVSISYNVFAENWPYYEINSLESDPDLATAPTLFADCNDGNMYVYWTGSAPGTGYRTHDLSTQGAADLEAALTVGWFGIGFYDEDNYTTAYYDSCYGAGGSLDTDEPYITVETSTPPPPPKPCGGDNCDWYYWASNEPDVGDSCLSQPAYNWVTLAPADEDTLWLGDDQNVPVPLGISFPFYGQTWDTVRVESNGFLSFTYPYPDYNNQCLPFGTTQVDVICWYWDDLNASAIPSPAYYGNAVVDGHPSFVITFVGYPEYYNTGSITAQVILKSNGNIKIQYGEIIDSDPDMTVGIQNYDATCWSEYHCNVAGVGPIYQGLVIEYGTDETRLPVELTSFEAVGMDEAVRLTWTTASETNNDHFALYRSTSEDGEYSQISTVEGAGNSATENNYSYVDRNLVNGVTYYYHLEDVDINGLATIHDITVSAIPGEGAMGVMVDEYKLYQNYPNPFNPTTTITYDVKEAGHVTLAVFNVLGQEVMTLVDDVQQSNRYQVSFDASGLAAGVYFYRVNVNEFNDVAKMVLLK